MYSYWDIIELEMKTGARVGDDAVVANSVEEGVAKTNRTDDVAKDIQAIVVGCTAIAMHGAKTLGRRDVAFAGLLLDYFER